MNETTTTALGFAHFLTQADAVGKSLLVILVLMSAASWALIVIKGVTQMLRKRRSAKFLNLFWNARSLDEVQHEIATHGADNPFAHLTAHAVNAQAHHARYGASKLSEAGSAQDFLTRTIKKVLDEERTRAWRTASRCSRPWAPRLPSSACSVRSGACTTRCSPSA